MRCMSELEHLVHLVLDGVRGAARPVLDEAERDVGVALLEGAANVPDPPGPKTPEAANSKLTCDMSMPSGGGASSSLSRSSSIELSTTSGSLVPKSTRITWWN